MAKVYFVTGKGGTGKSSLARALATQLAAEKKQVLLLKIDSFALSHEGDANPKQVAQNYWEQKIHQRRAVEEYFKSTLSKIPLPKSFSRITSKLQEGISSKLLANKFVMKFIDACPGLTPTIILGKVCWESKEGGPRSDSASSQKWDVVVVDAPSTGQALQVFESSKILSRILAQGLIAKHIHDTLIYALNKDFEVHLVTLPEEGPLQECLETHASFVKLEKDVARIWINKVTPASETQKLSSYEGSDPALKKIVDTELKRIEDQGRFVAEFESKLPHISLSKIPEYLEGEEFRLEGDWR